MMARLLAIRIVPVRLEVELRCSFWFFEDGVSLVGVVRVLMMKASFG